MTEWQPIETAPKDGSRILVFVSGDYGKWAGTFTAWWAGYAWLTGQEYEPGDDEETDGTVRLKIPPTHWMPLPEPPHASSE